VSKPHRAEMVIRFDNVTITCVWTDGRLAGRADQARAGHAPSSLASVGPAAGCWASGASPNRLKQLRLSAGHVATP
jgi:hypothetical protein